MIMGVTLEGALSRKETNASNAKMPLTENMDTLFALIVHELDIEDKLLWKSK